MVRQLLTAAQKVTLEDWRGHVEKILVAASPAAVRTELAFWLNAMAFVVAADGTLSIPWKKDTTSFWATIEHFWWQYYTTYATTDSAASPTAFGVAAKNLPNAAPPPLTALWAAYPPPLSASTLTGKATFYDVCTALYNRVTACLSAHNAALVALDPEYDSDIIWAGMLTAFMAFLTWTADYEVDSYTGTVGPYTVVVDTCANDSVIGWTITGEEMHIDHQSVDADLLLQGEEQTTVAATELLSADHHLNLAAGVALQGEVSQELDADVALLGEAQTPVLASVALRDEVQKTIAADELLAATHSFDLPASLRLIAVPLVPLDADLCILGQATKTFSAYMLLLPDSASEMLTDLEKYHIQAMRIKADPRSYKVYNSETDTEIIP